MEIDSRRKKTSEDLSRTVQPVRVLFFSHTPFIAGGEVNLIALLKTINKQKITAYLCYNPSSQMDSQLRDGGTFLLPFRLPTYQRSKVIPIAYAMGQLMYILFHHDIQLVYANTGNELKFLLPLCRMLGIPVIAHIHIQEEDRVLRWFKLRRVQRILFPSRATMQGVQKGSPWIDAHKCHYVHNAVDMSFYQKKDTLALKAEMGLDDGWPILGMIGRLREDKGQHLFLTLVSRLIAQGIKAHYIVVGEDNDQGGAYEDYLKKIACDLGIDEAVRFMGFRSDVPEMMSLCDLLIVPSLKEPFGRVVIEAMACETPVVASAVDGILEIFKDGEGGLFFKTGSVDDLTAKVLYFFYHPDWWQDQKKKAWRVCNERFRQEIHTRRIEEHINDVLGLVE